MGKGCRGVMEIQKKDFESVLGCMAKRESELRLRKASRSLENQEREYVDGSEEELGCATAQSDGHGTVIEGDDVQGRQDCVANITRPQD